jgi:hypothetical protein
MDTVIIPEKTIQLLTMAHVAKQQPEISLL